MIHSWLKLRGLRLTRRGSRLWTYVTTGGLLMLMLALLLAAALKGDHDRCQWYRHHHPTNHTYC